MKTLPASAMRSNGADYLRTYHHVQVGPEVPLEDIMRPSFWAHHVNSIRVHDLIDVVASDGSLDCQFRVIGKGVGFVTLRPRLVWLREDRKDGKPADDVAKDDSDLPEIPEGYIVNHTPKTKWRVFTKDPQQETSRDHASKREAIEAAIAHNKQANG